MLDKVRKTIKNYHMVEAGDKIVTGVSGGADSVALLMLLLELRQEYGLTIVVAHINHMLREAAKEEEAYVKALCEREQVECRVFHKDIAAYSKELGCSTEEAGRMYRYQCFTELAAEMKPAKIAVAHHRNDRIETMLFHMVRGTGLKGMQGIPPIRNAIDEAGNASEISVIRPLYDVSRQEIEDYLQEHAIRYYTDESNLENIYSRNRIRNRIIPELVKTNEQAVTHMAELSEKTYEYWEYVEQQAIKFEQDNIKEHCIPVTELINCPKLLQKHILYRQLAQAAGREKDIEDIHIEAIRELLQTSGEKTLDLPYGVQAVKSYDCILLGKQADDAETKQRLCTPDYPCLYHRMEELTWDTDENNPQIIEGVGSLFCTITDKSDIQELSKKHYTKMLDYDTIKFALCIRNPKPEDYMVIDRQGNRKKVSRILIDSKIPKTLRDSIVVVADGDHVIWLIGLRISEACKVTEQTGRVMELRIEPETASGYE